MGEALTCTAENFEKRKLAALGPSERKPKRTALQRIFGRARVTARVEAEQPLREYLQEELMGLQSAGGVNLVEAARAVKKGEWRATIGHLVDAGLNAHEAYEILEVFEDFSEHAAMKFVQGPTFALEAAKYQLGLALNLIRQAHREGEADAMIYKYAAVWSTIIVDRLYGDVKLAPHEPLAHLEEARRRAQADAFETIRLLGAEEDSIAAQLRQELGTPSNARRALMELVMESGGIHGVVLHDRAVR
jgi:hypothetical protein